MCERMIVTYRHRRTRPGKAAQPALTVGRIVVHPHRYNRVKKAPAPDAEADERVAAFFAKMIRPVAASG